MITSVQRLALLGNPNCGKSVLFNRLTGSRQKVANYSGVTVDVKTGYLKGVAQHSIQVIDLPGTYSLYPSSEDERVACSAILEKDVVHPDLIAVVVNATLLVRGLRLIAALKRRNVPFIVVLTMMDKAKQAGIDIDTHRLSQIVNAPVIEATGISKQGSEALKRYLYNQAHWPEHSYEVRDDDRDEAIVAQEDDEHARRWLREADLDRQPQDLKFTRHVDRWLLDPFIGTVFLLLVLFLIFQAVFSWSEGPMGLIDSATSWVANTLDLNLSDGLLKSLLIEGIIAGIGGVIIFLPQILILFLFILILEESGYLPRAALLLDRLMIGIGLSGRSFIPLLSSFACAIPGVMAARTIPDPRSRWVTIAIAPLMTCSARLPVYALLIGAFIPAKEVSGMSLQGLVLFGLYLLGIFSAISIAWLAKRWLGEGKSPDLMLELPDYHMPRVSSVLIGLWHRAWIFIKNVGGIILALTIILWALASFPGPPEGATGAPIEYSLAGIIGQYLAVIFEPIGFNWQISIALIPGLAAREVIVSALGTVYALSGVADDAVGEALLPIIADQWSFATGMSLLIWFVYAPQCLATMAVIRKETGKWQLSAIILVYLFSLAYFASWITYQFFSGIVL